MSWRRTGGNCPQTSIGGARVGGRGRGSREVYYHSCCVRRFELSLPDTLAACQQALADGPDVKLVAGGTDLLPQMKNGLVKARRVVDLSQLPELQLIERLSDGSLRVGAGVSARSLELTHAVGAGFTTDGRPGQVRQGAHRAGSGGARAGARYGGRGAARR